MSGRVPYLADDELTDEQRRLTAEIGGPRSGTVRGPFAIWLRTPAIANAANQLVLTLRKGTIPPRLYELITLVVSRQWSAQYSWYAHNRHAPDVGLDPDVIEAIRTRRVPPFRRDDERLAYEIATELLDTRDLSGATYARAVQTFGLELTIEIVSVIGVYTAIVMMLKAFDAPVPGDARPLD